MKVNLSEKDKIEFEKILKIKDNNIEISDLLLTAFAYSDFINVDKVQSKMSSGFNEENAIMSIIFDNFEINSQKTRDDYSSQINIKKCVPDDFFNDYASLLKGINFSYRNYKLKTISYEPYQLFALDEIKITKDYKEISQVGYFDKKYQYIALFEGKNLWMSLNPNEINTMSYTIKNACGDVLVLGLGMGYISYMLSNSKKVKTITVIERNFDNISLFKKYIFEKFPNKSKTKIINCDAIDFVKKNNNFDYIFADLWFTPEDGIEYYLKLHEIENESKIKIDYWLNDSIIQMKRRYLIELIKEQIDGLGEENYQSEQEPADRIFKYLYNQTKNLEINTIEQIKELLKCDQ